MASTPFTPFMSFLRPLGLPRSSTFRHFIRFSTSAPCTEEAAARPREDPNLVASRSAPECYPPPSMFSNPRPKVSRASRRTNHPTKQRHYPTRRPSHHQPPALKLIPDPVAPLREKDCAPNLPYYVKRSNYDSLPIYLLRKRGGNLHQTKIKNIDGDRMKMKLELCKALGISEDKAAVNPTTGHIILKGHWKPQVDKFLRRRKF